MGNLAILPSQKGLLPNEADLHRYMGVEIEFHPGTTSMQDFRFGLYKNGIDVMDDGCPYLHHLRQNTVDRNGVPIGPARYHQELGCTNTPSTSCSGRTTHLRPIFNDYLVLTTKKLVDLFPPGAEERFQNASSDWSNMSLGDIFQDRASHPIIFDRILAAVLCRIPNSSRRYWDLGTDPSAGFELRTIPIYTGEIWDALKDACNTISELGGNATSSCGGHIHLDMNQEPNEVIARTLAIYRMLEPLLAAPVEPSRYYERSYNAPTWREGHELLASGYKSIQTNKFNAGHYGGRWLQASQLQGHGSFEFRGLEGTLDPVVFKNYGLLLNRFIQAVRLGKPWGVKMHRIEPVAITTDSILAFFKFLDISRSGISDDLKEMREWYISRVREFQDRTAFTQHLLTNPKFILLKQLRSVGGPKHQELFSAPTLNEALSDKELGIRVRQVYTRILASCSPTRTWTQEPLSSQLYNRLGSMPRELGLLSLEEPPEHDTDDGFILRERRFRLIIEDGKCPLMDSFCDAMFSDSTEDLGKWYKTYISSDASNNAVYSEAFVLLFRSWLLLWTSGRPTYEVMLAAFTSGDASCVDF